MLRSFVCYLLPWELFLASFASLYHSFLRLMVTVTQAGDEILTAPTSALRTVQTVPKSISRLVGTISVNGLLATELAMDTSEVRAPWRAVLPTKEDFEESMPLMWHPSLQALLPPASLSLLESQRKKFSFDWAAVSTTFPTLSYDLYLYNWLIVSTRTFYYTSPKIKSKKPLNRDDCLALIPLADDFNHADAGCEVIFSPTGYKICTDRQIEEGEEVYISYGNHSNDFLLAEYGVILEQNRWDEISLDEIILPLFSEEQKRILKEADFLGNFILDKHTVCYRTQVALRLLYEPGTRWQRLVANGLDHEDKDQMTANRTLLKALKCYMDRVDEKLKEIEGLHCGLVSQRETLSRRWKQIRLLLTVSISRIES